MHRAKKQLPPLIYKEKILNILKPQIHNQFLYFVHHYGNA